MPRSVPYPPHEFEFVTDECRYCGARRSAVEDNLASAACDIAKQVPWQRIALPVALGLLITIVMLKGLVFG